MCPNPKGGGGVGGGEDIIHRYIFAEKMWVAFANAKATHLLSAKIIAYMPYLMIKSFNDTLTNDIISFEHTGPILA